MACCGNKRNRLKKTYNQEATPVVTAPPKTNTAVKFIYEGKDGKMLRGAITRRSYYFRYRGHILAVDERDKAGCIAEPDLRFVE